MTTPPSTKLNCARTDCEHCVVPASVTRRSQDWTGHRLGGIKPGGPVNPQKKDYTFAALFTTRTGRRRRKHEYLISDDVIEWLRSDAGLTLDKWQRESEGRAFP